MRPQGRGFSRRRRGSGPPRARLALHGGSRAALLATALLALLAGCAGVARPPRPPHAPPRPRPGYDRLADSLGAFDPSLYAGKRIVLDPGHGGFFRGSLGVHGLTEAEVNLGVALRLRDLLVERGAEVLMTRTTDRDFLTPADSSLRADLAERVRLANAFAPDLFVSIHHNADAGGAHDVNETQTYYKLGDEGPSLDAAESIHRALVHNVGIEKNKLVPGNYFVLRNTDAPAVLTESSYLTNPDVEARLALPEKQALEAGALLVGLGRAFARRVPIVAEFAAFAGEPGAAGGVRADSVFRSGPGPLLRARIEGACDQVELRLDGEPVPLTRRDDLIEWRPDRPMAPGPHRAVLRARLSGQGAARERRLDFTIARPARRIAWQAFPSAPPRAGGLVGVRVQVLDAYGFAVPESLRVHFRSSCACDTLVPGARMLRDGVAWGYLALARRRPEACATRAGLTVTLPGTRLEGTPFPAAHATLRLATRGAPAWRAAFVRVEPGDSALTDAPGSRDFGAARSWINRDGFALFPLDSAGRVSTPALPGFRPRMDEDVLAGRTPPLRWAAIAGGALAGRRIVIDADGGGEDAAGQGPSGTRAASLNLETARILAGFLAAAGAQVQLTRAGDQAMSEVQRVQASEGFRPDRFIRVGHRAEPARVGYYFSSVPGRRWAERTAGELERLGVGSARVGEDAQYPLQQVSCPALYVAAARVDSAEGALLTPGALRAEAYALFLALAGEWAGEAVWPLDSVEVRDASGRPVAGAPVTLGGAFVLETDTAGRARFARTEPGPIALDAHVDGSRVRRVLLDLDRGAVLTGPATGR